jgi:hypothetical protein
VSWLPSGAPETNHFQVVVSDSGVPSLTATQNFSVITLPAPVLQVTTHPGMLVFTWNSVPGQQYQMEYKDQMEAPQWLPVGPVIWGTGETLSVTNAVGTELSKFFRLSLAP